MVTVSVLKQKQRVSKNYNKTEEEHRSENKNTIYDRVKKRTKEKKNLFTILEWYSPYSQTL